jgi:UDP-glucose 4-epimerase
MKNCCIIGGSGFIGHHLVEHLLTLGMRVTVVGRSPAPKTPLPEKAMYISGNIEEEKFLEDILHEADSVIHLAYASVPKTSFEDPILDIRSNLPSTVRLLEAACNYNLEKFVLVSSGGTIYGKAQSIPISEDHPKTPVSPYGITKLALENYAMMYHEIKSLPIVCARPSNAYGEGQLPFTGQGFIATAIASILEGKPVTIFGETGTIRDYIHVQDVASGIAAALLKGKAGDCYNLSSGIGRSNKEVLDKITPLAESAGLHPTVITTPSRKFDVPVNVLDSAKLCRETGWSASIPFDVGIKRTWEWYFQRYSKKRIVP